MFLLVPKRLLHWRRCLVSTCVRNCKQCRKVLRSEPAEMTCHTVQMGCRHNSLMCLQKFTAKSFPFLPSLRSVAAVQPDPHVLFLNWEVALPAPRALEDHPAAALQAIFCIWP